MELQGLLDSKKEYVEHLCDTFAESVVACFQRIYNECIDNPDGRGKSILTFFQEQLGSIARWNVALINEEYRVARKRSGCKYVADLIKAILVTYVKIAIVSNTSSMDCNKVKLRVPTPENFYHKVLIICAREVWKQPYLLYHKVRSIELQQNLNELELIARKAIKSAIRMYIPMDQLVRDIKLGSESSSSSDSEPEESEHSDEEQESESESESESEEYELEQHDDQEDAVDQEEAAPESDHDDQEDAVVEKEPEPESDPEDHEEAAPESDHDDTENAVDQEEAAPEEPSMDIPDEAVEERRSIEISSDNTYVIRDVTCDVAKVEEDTTSSVDTHKVVEEPKKRIIMGSMLINKARHKLSSKSKRDAFF